MLPGTSSSTQPETHEPISLVPKPYTSKRGHKTQHCKTLTSFLLLSLAPFLLFIIGTILAPFEHVGIILGTISASFLLLSLGCAAGFTRGGRNETNVSDFTSDRNNTHI